MSRRRSPFNRCRSGGSDRSRRRAGHGAIRSGFTLVEVLVTLMFLAIVLPTIMEGITLASSAASSARQRTEAAGLAESKLSELVAGQEWNSSNLSGDFSPSWPDYRWQAAVQAWPGDTTGLGIQEVDLTVFWKARGRDVSLTLSTLAFDSSDTSDQ